MPDLLHTFGFIKYTPMQHSVKILLKLSINKQDSIAHMNEEMIMHNNVCLI